MLRYPVFRKWNAVHIGGKERASKLNKCVFTFQELSAPFSVTFD
jgi:hypothetical protein